MPKKVLKIKMPSTRKKLDLENDMQILSKKTKKQWKIGNKK